ncbi:uncharacterized protein LOC111370652 isoform X1 [Olea europaea var. sylvestris]|uniref:uncharacterized protein LOC111370652 isoform X1 n=1 Tax=Olea europaea var. sylvestris TaxID=158386 RepID=UPI000C1D50E5|nr:uncharacterized protein LOC111370652 isoform X1 [Olea europaea var. sylvestris]
MKHLYISTTHIVVNNIYLPTFKLLSKPTYPHLLTNIQNTTYPHLTTHIQLFNHPFTTISHVSKTFSFNFQSSQKETKFNHQEESLMNFSCIHGDVRHILFYYIHYKNHSLKEYEECNKITKQNVNIHCMVIHLYSSIGYTKLFLKLDDNLVTVSVQV